MRNRLHFIVVCLFVLLIDIFLNPKAISAAVVPGTYYVDIGQASEGDGSAGSPWKTLHTAITEINGGTTGSYTLNVAAGTYSVPDELDAALTVTQDNVTIVGESGSYPVLDGAGASSWDVGIEIEGNNVAIRDLDIEGFSTKGILIGGDDVTIFNCSVHDNGTGIALDPLVLNNNVTIRGCELDNNSSFGISVEEAKNVFIRGNKIRNHGFRAGVGIYIKDATDGVTIAGNLIDSYDYGIAAEDCSPTVDRNRITDNNVGIYIDGAGKAASPTIRNNIIHPRKSTIENGIGVNGNASPSIYHNTIDGGSNDGIYIDVSSGTPYIEYNIITNFGQYGINVSSGSPIIDYNDVWNNGTNYYNWTKGTNDISQDPLYTSYKLQSTSPCIDQIPTDSGDPVTIDFGGYSRPRDAGYDMGAYEFVSDITHDYSLPGGSGDVTDYRIFTVPVKLKTGSALKAQMEDALGTYNKYQWRVFVWDGTSSSYIEMDDPAFADLLVWPGMAFWIISTGTDTISFEGQPFRDGIPYVAPVSPGWNMVALPWANTSIDLDKIAVSDGVNTYWITSDSNTLTQRSAWDYTGSGPYSGYEQLALGSALQHGKGYWIKVEEADFQVRLLVPPDNSGGYFEASSYQGVSKSTTSTDSDEGPPPPPGGSVSYTPDSSGIRVASETGGCFIATAAYGSRPHPYVKPLRSFRDTYLLKTLVGKKLVDLYYHYSPPVTDFIAQHGVSQYLTRLLLIPLIGFSACMLDAGHMTKLVLLLTLMLAASWIIWWKGGG